MQKVTLKELFNIASNSREAIWNIAQEYGREPKIYLHWSAGHYHSFFSDYHINIDSDGSIYVSTTDFSKVLSHTYRRNSGAIGISLSCCYGGTSNDLGNEPPTKEQIESMSRCIAVVAKALWLTVRINNVMTHGEAADNLDGWYAHEPYGPATTCERWDLAILENGDVWNSGGDTLRGKALWYQKNYPDGVENHF